ncbi:hypothetical protein FACS1894180_2940 [Bacteroidia bacterium]|nr:hypothetical protein FACS1894180_2940 [Bacteroidia bacterium]
MSRRNLDRKLDKRNQKNKKNKKGKVLKADEGFNDKERKNICSFWCYFVVFALLVIGISIWDGFVTFGTDGSPVGRLISQLLIAALTCISMMLVFGEMNNVCLKLSDGAVAIMFLYAGIQLFAPFGNKEIINETYISSPLFTFFITTLCFFGKFMVFMIIRWMFTGGRLSYVFIDSAFRHHSNKLSDKKQDEKNYKTIFLDTP